MIRVKVLPPSFCNLDCLDERGWIDLNEGARLADVLKIIRMPRIVSKMLLASVNGERATLDTVLRDGDVVGFFMLVSGG